MFNSPPEWRTAQKQDDMNNETNKALMMLRYKLDRYRAMGNGTMCQKLIGELHRMQMKNAATN